MESSNLKCGTKARVVHPLGGLERANLGIEGEIVRYSQPHGYAVLKTTSGAEVHVHPEALEPT